MIWISGLKINSTKSLAGASREIGMGRVLDGEKMNRNQGSELATLEGTLKLLDLEMTEGVSKGLLLDTGAQNGLEKNAAKTEHSTT